MHYEPYIGLWFVFKITNLILFGAQFQNATLAYKNKGDHTVEPKPWHL